MCNKYEDFYSGPNRIAMHRIFCSFVECLRTDDFRVLKELCTADCKCDFSTAGSMIGIEEMENGLKWPGPSMDISKATIWNFVARSRGGAGRQTAYIQCIRAIDDGISVYPFLYGGQFSNTFVCENGEWKLSDIRFDLCYEYGNNCFVKDKWTLMDYSILCGHKPSINTELDNPWLVIPEDDEPQTDEEQIFELMFKYAYAFDNGDFRFLQTFVTDDFFINGAKQSKDHCDRIPEPGDFQGHREISDFLRGKFHKEAKMQHSCRMTAINREGDRALAYMLRGEEHRLKNRVLNRNNIHSVFATAVHLIYAVKTAQGEWKMYKYRIEPYSEMVTVDDDCMLYDEHILTGGAGWNR